MEEALSTTFVDSFWAWSEQAVQVVVPIIAIVLIFKVIYDLLLRER